MESIVAAVILLLVAVGVISALIATGGWYARATIRTQAASVASEILAEIRSRNYDALQVVQGGTWPAAIPATMTVDTANGYYSVETRMEAVVDTLTIAPMKRITVTVDSLRQPMAAPVVATAYVSGWSSVTAETPQFYVPVSVQCVDETDDKDVSDDARVQLDGITVELRSINNVSETGIAYHAVTGSDGIAHFPSVAEGEYWLTSEPTDPHVHPKYFPRRIYPAHGGSVRNPIYPDNRYNLAVVTRTDSTSPKATLRVGAYRDKGWPSSSPVVGLRIYAQPDLNTGIGSSGYFGTDKTRYPLPADDPLHALTYSAVTNAYGVAVIQIPWTLETGQQWHVWYHTAGSDAEYRDKMTDYAGSWAEQVSEPEMPPSNVPGDILQFQFVLGDPQ